VSKEIEELIVAQGKAFAEFKKANDERIEALEKGTGAAEITAKVDRINADLDKFSKAINDVQARLDKTALSGGLIDDGKALDELRLWARKREKGEFRSAVQTNNDPAGGYTVLPEFEKLIDHVASANSSMRQLATVTSIGSGSFKQLVAKSGVSAAWSDELETLTDSATPNLAQIEIFAHKLTTLATASEESIEDAFLDIAAWLASEFGVAFADAEGAAFITGVGPKQPQGILSVAAVANESYAWGSVGYVASGKSAAFADSNPSDALISLVHALKAKYRNNGAFLLADGTLGTIRKFKDSTGNYIWQPSLVANVPDMLLGKPVFTDDNMPAIAANSLSIAFGDWKAAYRIVDRRGVKIISDPYTMPGATKFYGSKRVGGGVKNFEAYKVMKFAAS
jgi:HK97 family phage major capsid protein